MSRRDTLLEKMRIHPRSIRFSDVAALLKYEGFVLFNQRGSHCTYHRRDGRVLTLVRPHGRHKMCHPADVKKLLDLLKL